MQVGCIDLRPACKLSAIACNKFKLFCFFSDQMQSYLSLFADLSVIGYLAQHNLGVVGDQLAIYLRLIGVQSKSLIQELY